MKTLHTHNDIDTALVFNDSFLERTYLDRMVVIGCTSIAEYLDQINSDTIEKKAFSDSLYISYSEFFRNPLTFAVLEQVVLPQLLNKMTNAHRSEMRIWSAGCASGQEPYSLAILLEELLEQRSDAGYRIFATDISEQQLIKAKNGIYRHESLGKVTFSRLNQWFRLHQSGYTVLPKLGHRIDFSHFDLLADSKSSPPSSIFGSFDLVLCCNLLIYFKPLYRKLILNKLARSMRQGAFLVSGETERSFIMENGFVEVFPQSAVFQAQPLPCGSNNE